jgi:SpoVK/Ycf46/Vps4 family AAA+-type ATPase
MQTIVMNTPGYVGADLNALIDEALISALDRRLIDRLISNNNESVHKIDFNLSQNCNFLVNLIKLHFL